MKTILFLTAIIIGNLSFAGGEVAGGRLTALGSSQLKIQAAIAAISDATLEITQVTILSTGQVKVNLTSPNDGSCRAVIFDIKTDPTGAGIFQAVNPQRATCN